MDREYDFYEKKDSDKDKPKGKEIEYKFVGERDITDYFKYQLTVTFFLQYITPVSENLVSGTARVSFMGKVLLDYRKKWQPGLVSAFLFRIYNNYLIKDLIKKQRDRLYKETTDLHDLAREILEFNR